LIKEIPGSDPRLDAIAALTFLNTAHERTRKMRGASRREVALPTRSMLRELAARLTPAASEEQALAVAMANLEDDWGGEVRHRAGQAIEIRHDSITQILFRWIFGGAKSRGGDVRRDKWSFYSAIARLLLDRGDKDQFLTLIENAGYVLAYDRKNRVFVDDESAVGLLLELISGATDVARNQDEKMRLELVVARLHVHLATSEEVGDPTGWVELALSSLNNVLSLAGLSSRTAIDIAWLLGDLPQPLSTLRGPDGREYDWHQLIGEAITQAEAAGRFSEADNMRREYLTKLLATLRGKGKGAYQWPYSRFERICALAVRSRLSEPDSGWGDQRIESLCKFARWAAATYQDDVAVPVGTYTDDFGTSRRSIYRAIWMELAKLAQSGDVNARIARGTLSSQLSAVATEWVGAEEAIPPAQRLNPELLNILKRKDWPELAKMPIPPDN
jgi:hypothetical protein